MNIMVEPISVKPGVKVYRARSSDPNVLRRIVYATDCMVVNRTTVEHTGSSMRQQSQHVVPIFLTNHNPDPSFFDVLYYGHHTGNHLQDCLPNQARPSRAPHLELHQVRELTSAQSERGVEVTLQCTVLLHNGKDGLVYFALVLDAGGVGGLLL